MDVCKVGAGLYHYTTTHDCPRYQVVGVFLRKSAASTLTFLEQFVEELPFSIQRIQTDRGPEFFAHPVQDRFREWSIKFRPTADLADPERDDRLAEWQHFYNWDRPHDRLGDHPPIDRVCDLLRQAPTGEEIAAKYDSTREFIMPRSDWPPA